VLRRIQGNRLKANSGAGYILPQTQALVARFTTPPSLARMILINNLIGALITAGVWAKLDTLYLFAAADSQAARQNWIQNLYNCTAVSSPTFTTDRGYAGDGAASHVDSGFNPSTASTPKFARNSAYFGFWSRTSGTQTVSAAGAFVADGITRLTRNTSNDSSGRINQSAALASVGSVVTDGSGLFGIARSGASVNRLSRNGANLTTGTDASTALVNATIKFGTINGVSFSAVQFAAGMFGENLSVAEETSAYTAVLAYLTAVGAA